MKVGSSSVLGAALGVLLAATATRAAGSATGVALDFEVYATHPGLAGTWFGIVPVIGDADGEGFVGGKVAAPPAEEAIVHDPEAAHAPAGAVADFDRYMRYRGRFAWDTDWEIIIYFNGDHTELWINDEMIDSEEGDVVDRLRSIF